MNNTGKKRPLGEYLGENSLENQTKRRRYDNVVLLRGRRRSSRHNQNNTNTSDTITQRNIRAGESSGTEPLRVAAAGKRKKPGDEQVSVSTEEKSTDENDIISELTKQFKKARLRPVFFTISSFIEQTVDEVGFTLADEPEAEVTIRLSLPIKSVRHYETESTTDDVSEEATLTIPYYNAESDAAGELRRPENSFSGGTFSNASADVVEIGNNFVYTSSVFVFKAGREREAEDEGHEDGERKVKKMKTSQD